MTRRIWDKILVTFAERKKEKLEMTRRIWGKILVTFAIGVVLVFMPLLGACVGQEAGRKDLPARKEAAKEAPSPRKPQGTLTLAVAGLGNERYSPDGQSEALNWMSPVYEFLAYWDDKGNLNPGLAERWVVSPDALNVTFYLRKGVRFHGDWGELTADDVKFTWDLVSRKGTTNVQGAAFASLVDKVTVVDPYQISFVLTEPIMNFVEAWANPLVQFPIVSKRYTESMGEEKAFRSPVGSGPFKFVEHKEGAYLKFEALAEHWRQVPYFANLTIRAIPEEASRLAMLRAGDADIADVSRRAKNELLSAGLKIKSVPNSAVFGIALGGLQNPGLKNYDPSTPWNGTDPNSEKSLKVRKALNLAVNRQAIVDYVFMGEASLEGLPAFFPGTPTWDPSWKPYAYDPNEAKRLLAEAGFPNGFEMSLWLFPLPGRTDMPAVGEAVAMDWEKIGVKVKLLPTQWSSITPKLTARDLHSNAWPWGQIWSSEPYISLIRQGRTNIGYDSIGFASLEQDKLLVQASMEPDPAKRAAIQKKIGQLIYDNYLWVPIASTNSVWGFGKQVEGWPQAQGSTYLSNFEYVTPSR